MTDYTESDLEKMIKLWNVDCRTASEIASIFGVSRSAIIGKIRRLLQMGKFVESPARTSANLAGSPRKPIRRGAYIPQVGNIKSERIEEPLRADPSRGAKTVTAHSVAPQRVVHVQPSGIAVAALRPRACKWPIGDPSDASFSFCGRDSMSGRPYCEEHNILAHPVNAKPVVSISKKVTGFDYPRRNNFK